MSYASGGIIQASDFNGLANETVGGNVAWVWGTGYGAVGYGQSTTALASLSTGATVTATQWSGFLSALNNAAMHQSGSGNSLGPLNYTAGEIITYFSNVTSKVSTINTDYALYASQGSTTTGSNFTLSCVSDAGGTFWQDRVVTFASADAARYFFNAGGQLNLRISVSGGTGSASNNSFTAIVTALDGVNVYNTTNSGRTGTGLTLTTNDTGIGYRTMPINSAPLHIQVNDTASAYTNNYGGISIWSDNTDTTNGANGTKVILRTWIVIADHTWDDSINCTLNMRVDIVYPETTYLTSSWGTPTVS